SDWCCMICTDFFWLFLFFFSSRRRHTSSTRDWSSDVCSSDLNCGLLWQFCISQFAICNLQSAPCVCHGVVPCAAVAAADFASVRSEERRVGEECRLRGGAGL